MFKLQFPYRYRVLVLLFFLAAVTYLDRVCISLVGVRIKAAFGLSNEQFGWILGAFALSYALFEIPSGMLGDRFGQRKVLIRIVFWWSLFTALTGLAVGFVSLLIIRFFFGMGEAGAYPNGSAVISRWMPASETSKGIAALFLGQHIGASIAPLVVVPVAISLGWRTTFFLCGCIGIAWVLVCYAWFRNEPTEMRGISIKEINHIQRNRRFGGHPVKISWGQILASRNMIILPIMHFCSTWGLYFFVAWMPIYLIQGKHFSEDKMKFTSSFTWLIGIVGALTSGLLGDWVMKIKGLAFSRRCIGGLALGLTGLFLAMAALSNSQAMIVVFLVVAGLSFSFYPISAFSACVDVGGSNAGTVAGIMNGVGQSGAFVLSILFGKLVDLTHNFNFPLYIIAAILIAGAPLWLLIDPRKKVELEAIHSQVLVS